MYNHWLDTFVSAAHFGSFAKAGEDINLSKTSVLKHIHSLEAELGVTLFDRTAKGVSLTPEGAFLLVESQKLTNEDSYIRTQIKHVRDDVSRVIRVGISPINPLDAFNEIWQRSPHVDQFSVVLVSYPADINTAVPDKTKDTDYSDIGFCSESSPDHFVSTEAVFFTEYRVTCAVPVSHPLASRKSLTIDDLKGQTIVVPTRGNPHFASQFIRTMEKQHPDITFKSVPLFYDLQLFNRYAKEGKILLSLDCWSHLHPEMVDVPVDWDWRLPYGIIYKRDARPEVLEFIEAFKEAMEMKKTPRIS